MTSISSVSSSSLAQYASLKNTPKTDLADQLFNKLDSKQQGYIDKEQLQTALTSAAGKGSGSATNSDDLFAKIDGDGDGKITKQELSNSLQSLMDQVDNMAARMRVQGSAGGKAGDQGFSQDELVQMASDTRDSDSKRASFMSNIAANFAEVDSDANGKVTGDEAKAYAEATGQEMEQPSGPAGGMRPPPSGGGAPAGGPGGASATTEADTSGSDSTDPADTNGDGTVSAKEALAYLMTQLSSDESSATSGSASSADPSGFSDKIARQILQLVEAYGNNSATIASGEESSALSVSA